MAEYFWCTLHHRVEQQDDRCSANFLMGPYPSEEAAASYAETAEQRDEAWAAEDERWEGS